MIPDIKSRFNNIFFRRREAYRRIFNPDSDDARVVLADLQKFCRGRGTKFMGDVNETHVMIGQNNVWERIQSYVNIPESTLSKLTETTPDE